MWPLKGCFLLMCLILVVAINAQSEFEPGESNGDSLVTKRAYPVRYLLYEVNAGEGFNLRRDVYIRMANMLKFMNNESDQKWVLVLPPWGNLYHWKEGREQGIEQLRMPWSKFFDLASLRKHIPVMELADWMKVVGEPAKIDEVYYLQSYKEGWEDGKWTERWDERACNEPNGYIQDRSAAGLWHGWFWGYDEITAKSFKCMSCQAEIQSFAKFVSESTKGRSVMIHRAETLTHGRFSEWSKEWWSGRRSLRFSKKLRDIGNNFREQFLDSNDEDDKTERDPDWTMEKPELGSALGGPYIAVHMRRQDFARSSMKAVPSLKSAAAQIIELLKKENLTRVYVATDAPESEYTELKKYLKPYEAYKLESSKTNLQAIGDGGIAIIDQWICAHARYFTGTSSSTFSFRIMEERSLIGLPPDSTYNRLCGENEDKDMCAKEQPTRWFPQYD